MTWTRLPDDFTDRPEVLRLSRSARLLHVEALVWCNRLLTNGVIPANVVRRVSDSNDPDRDASELAGAGLWTRCDIDAWQVDWSGQETAEVVEQRREDRNARQRRYNERQRRHAKRDHSMCDPRFCPTLRNASRGASANSSDDAYPTRPDPTGREGQGQEGGTAASATAPAAARPQRASGGWLATLDAATLAALPWNPGHGCPHESKGWTWTRDDALACNKCDRAARSDQGTHYEARYLTERRLGWHANLATAPLEVWQTLHAKDPRGVTLALDLASALFNEAGPVIPDPERVNALADDIYRRSINADLHADVWAAHEHTHQEETP